MANVYKENHLKQIKRRHPNVYVPSPIQTDTIVNLSYVGKVGKNILKDGIYQPIENIEICAKYNAFGRGLVYRKRSATNTENLKRGGRKNLNKSNLTPHARRCIQGVGDLFEHKVNSNELKESSVLVTLTYGRNVPDHQTAKQQLQLLIRNLKHLGHFKYYAWVAQLQTGERALKQGKTSYRAENGSAIHFHILTTFIEIKLLRKHWCNIVNKWEKKEGHTITKLGGVDIKRVLNASNYISKYITNETKSGNVLGNLWAISSACRKEIDARTTEPIKTNKQEWQSFVSQFKLLSKEHSVRDTRYNYSARAMKDWNNDPIVFCKNVLGVLRDFVKWKRNRIKNSNTELKFRSIQLN